MKDEMILTKVNGKTNRHKNGNGHRTIDIHDFDLFGDNHIATSVDTPMRDDAFAISDEEKMGKNVYVKIPIMNTKKDT